MLTAGSPEARFRAAGPDLAALWRRGVRLGESTVCSLCVHLVSGRDPDAVTVLLQRDAGQVFYGRAGAGEIVHLDVFHAPGAVPPEAVAGAFRRAAAGYGGALPSPDWFDCQTAVGGGRLGGALAGGRRPSVQAAHRGHVHLAGRLDAADAAFCFHLVAAVEAAVAACGLEPRKLLRVHGLPAGGPGPGDLEDYAALTDSWLRGPAPPRGGADPGPGGDDALLAAAARLADEGGGPAAVRALLEQLHSGSRAMPPRLGDPPRTRDALARLVQGGWAEAAGSGHRLTPAGQALRRVFATRLREIELALRAAARRLAGAAPAGLGGTAALGAAGRRRPGGAVPERGERLAELAAPETAVAACLRCLPGGARLRIGAPDVRLHRRLRPRRVDLLLLLDASASMEGGRMRAAKTLARHLLLTGRDRVAVMAFQERAAFLAVPLTRNFAAAERGLAGVSPAGLTPLSAGLGAARAYLQRSHARNPLLLLVTDGIPTVAGGGGRSPLQEALEEADRLRGSGIALCCIGLEPNERYLTELAHRAGGRLHVVSELRVDLLAALARRERLRRMEGG